MILKAGTYRFNNDLTFYDFINPEYDNFGNYYLNFDIPFTLGATVEDENLILEFFGLSLSYKSSQPDQMTMMYLAEDYPLPVYINNAWRSDVSPEEVAFIQTINVTKDTEVNDTFGAWYKANTNYNEVNGAITITWDGQIEGREAITISYDGTIETVGHLLGEIELDDVNSLIGSTFEVYADSSKGEISYIGSPITDITKVSEGMYQFGSFNLSTDDVTTGYHHIFTYAIKGVYSWEIVEGVVATVTVPKTGIYSEVQQAQTEPTYIPYVYPSKLTIPALSTKTKKFTRLYLGETVYSSNDKRFRKLQVVGYEDGSEGLEFTSNGDGTCYVSGIGTCTGTDIVIPSFSADGDIVTRIGNEAFKHCSSITSIEIPNSVTSIGNYAFMFCTSLKSVVIPNSVIAIGYNAFDTCSSLTSVTIPNSITTIYEQAFKWCTLLTDIIFEGTISQWRGITLYPFWNNQVPATYVQCTDGQVVI